jgi:putative nucleotidyltransferase with HDIG domain
MLRYPSKHEIEIRQYELMLEDILSAAEKLPPFPDIAWKVMPLLQKMAPIREIEAIIKYDQAITAKVLALSQSAYYGSRYRIASLQDAIVILGNQQLIQIILTACASRYFQSENAGYNMKGGELWRHSVATALLGEMLARRQREKKVLTVYTASLLHDIGKTVLNLYVKVHLGSGFSLLPKAGMEVLNAERSAVGIDHQQLGEIIARHWRFPAEVTVGVGHHHSPRKADSFQRIATLVYAANRMAAGVEEEEEKAAPLDVEEDEVFQSLAITPDLVAQFQARTRESLKSIGEFLTSTT